MANKLNITKGEYKNTDTTQSTYACVEIGEETVLTVQGVHCYDDRDKETSDIALLCADALNTYNQTPVLPSELLRQRDEAIKALNRINQMSDPGDYLTAMLDCKKIARETLKKIIK